MVGYTLLENLDDIVL